MLKLVTCKTRFLGQTCDWVSMQVSRKHAEKEVETFNAYFDTVPKKEQQLFWGGKKADISSYERCNRCGGSYKKFKKATQKEIPFGSTISPIIDRKE